MNALARLEYRFIPRWTPLDKLIFIAVVALLILQVITGVALADDSTKVSAGPLYQDLTPYLVALFGAILTVISGLFAAWFKKKTGIQIDDAMIARVNLAATNAAGRIFASQDANFANIKVDVGSRWIADEVGKLQVVMKDEINHLGWSPEYAAQRLTQLVQAKVGHLQAGAGQTPLLPPPAGATGL